GERMRQCFEHALTAPTSAPPAASLWRPRRACGQEHTLARIALFGDSRVCLRGGTENPPTLSACGGSEMRSAHGCYSQMERALASLGSRASLASGGACGAMQLWAQQQFWKRSSVREGGVACQTL